MERTHLPQLTVSIWGLSVCLFQADISDFVSCTLLLMKNGGSDKPQLKICG